MPRAMLKGWFDRVWLPGAPWWWLKLIADPGRSFLMRGLRPLYAKGCRMHWLHLYNMNHVTAQERARFLDRVGRELPRLIR